MQLTEHQRKIIKLLRTGISQEQIAQAIGTTRQAVTNNLCYLRKRNGISDNRQLLLVTAGIDLDRQVLQKRLSGIQETEAGTYRACIWVHHEKCPLGTHRTRAQALKIRDEALKLKYAGCTIEEIRRKLLPCPLALPTGVSQRTYGSWRARISVNGEQLILGHYKTKEAAILAVDEAKRLKQQGCDAQTIKAMALNAKPQ